MSNSRKPDTVDGAHVGLCCLICLFLGPTVYSLLCSSSLRVGLHSLNDAFHSQGSRAFDENDVAGKDRLAQVGQCFFGLPACPRLVLPPQRKEHIHRMRSACRLRIG